MRIIWFILAIPYIPQIIRGSDSQPTFSLILFATLSILLMNKQFISALLFNRTGVVILVVLISGLLVSILYNLFIEENGIYFPRLVAIIQFLIAFLFGISSLFYLPKRWLKLSLIVYALFTIVYFVTGGMIEEILIRSRSLGGIDVLEVTGRGARTLSPEPSIMSIHILNMFVLHCLYKRQVNPDILLFVLVLFPLLASFSGYGFFIAMALLLIIYPRIVIVIGTISITILGNYLMSQELSGLRILYILDGLRNNGIQFLMLDASFKSRFVSFTSYIDSFAETFPFGDAFSIFSGGGFISIISGLGLIGLLFFLSLLFLLLVSNYPFRLKALFFVWLVVYFISGSFAVPLVGLIVGVFVAKGFIREQGSYTFSRI